MHQTSTMPETVQSDVLSVYFSKPTTSILHHLWLHIMRSTCHISRNGQLQPYMLPSTTPVSTCLLSPVFPGVCISTSCGEMAFPDCSKAGSKTLQGHLATDWSCFLPQKRKWPFWLSLATESEKSIALKCSWKHRAKISYWKLSQESLKKKKKGCGMVKNWVSQNRREAPL